MQKYAVRENCHIGACKQQLCLSCLKKQVVFSTKIKLPRQPPKKVIKKNDCIFGTIGGWRRNPLLIYILSFPFLFSLFSLFSRPARLRCPNHVGGQSSGGTSTRTFSDRYQLMETMFCVFCLGGYGLVLCFRHSDPTKSWPV